MNQLKYRHWLSSALTEYDLSALGTYAFVEADECTNAKTVDHSQAAEIDFDVMYLKCNKAFEDAAEAIDCVDVQLTTEGDRETSARDRRY